METLDSQGWASLEPKGMVVRIYVGKPLEIASLQHTYTKYISCGFHGCREEDFKSFSHYKSMETLDPRGRVSLDPWGLIGRVYVGDY